MATFAHRASVNPRLLSWALSRSEGAPESIAKSLGVVPDTVEAWLAGESSPTFQQARSFARTTHVPFGLLFATDPPELRLPVADFRTFQGTDGPTPTPELLEVLFAIIRKQDWWRERLETQGVESNSVVGSAPADAAPADLAERLRSLLRVSPEWVGPADAANRFADLASRIEVLGVLVMQRGIVGNNTRRVLDPEDFRGFALADPVAPVIFVNAADSKASQVFTLVHELMHILSGESGVSSPLGAGVAAPTTEVERRADRAAGEFLVPRVQLRRVWRPDLDGMMAVESAARHFRVSELATAVAAFEIDLIDRAILDAIAERSISAWRRRQKPSGGNFYATAVARNGRRFTSEVLSAVDQRQALATEGASLLEVGVGHLAGVASALEGAR